MYITIKLLDIMEGLSYHSRYIFYCLCLYRDKYKSREGSFSAFVDKCIVPLAMNEDVLQGSFCCLVRQLNPLIVIFEYCLLHGYFNSAFFLKSRLFKYFIYVIFCKNMSLYLDFCSLHVCKKLCVKCMQKNDFNFCVL